MDVLTTASMRKVDEGTIARYCPGLELMERAGRRVAEFIMERFPKKHFKASIFVGPGNNGGDALVVARYLSEDGRACSIHYLTAPEKLTMDGFKNYQRLQQRMSDRGLKEINSTRPDWVNIVKKDLVGATVIVDGLFGTGLARPLEGRAASIVNLINDSHLPVVSIDIPSGINGDSGEILGAAVRAHDTVTMGFPKLGMLFHPGKAHVGELHVADLEFPDEVLQVHSQGMYLLDRDEAARRLPPRSPVAHKYRAGTVLLVAGSQAYTGAVMLAAEAALRSGCGMVYAAVPVSIRATVQGRVRESVVVGLPESPEGSIVPTALPELQRYVDKADTLAIGPGLGTHPATVDCVRELVRTQKPLVIDADGINALSGASELLAERDAPTVLTPHSGELAGLLGEDVPLDPTGRIELTRRVSKSLGVTLLHKGAPTLIASRDGDVWISREGDSSLATGGSGDVLTGLVAGVMAQGATALDGASVACFLHGRSGSDASQAHGVRGVVAGDLLDHMGKAMIELENLAAQGH